MNRSTTCSLRRVLPMAALVLSIVPVLGCDQLPPMMGTYVGREQVRVVNPMLRAAGMDPVQETAPEVMVTITSENGSEAQVEIIARAYARCRGRARRSADRRAGFTRLELDATACSYWSEPDAPSCPMRTRGPIVVRGNQTDGVFVTFAGGNATGPASAVCATPRSQATDVSLAPGLPENDPEFMRRLLRRRTQ